MFGISFLDANFIVLLAFVLFMFLALKYGYRRSLGFVDRQIGDIQAVINQAEKNFALAQEKNVETRAAQVQLSADIVALMEKTDHQIHGLKQQSMGDLNHLLESKQIVLDSMMEQLRSKTIGELRQTLSQGAYRVLSETLSHHLDKRMHETLNDDAIQRLEEIVSPPHNQNGSMDARPKEKKISM